MQKPSPSNGICNEHCKVLYYTACFGSSFVASWLFLVTMPRTFSRPTADEHVMVVPIVESVTARRSINQILEVDGVDVFFFAPSDYSSTAGYEGQEEGPRVAQHILQAKEAALAMGKHRGLLATSNENLHERYQQGFRMLRLGSDSGLLLRSLHKALDSVGRDPKLSPGLLPDDE